MRIHAYGDKRFSSQEKKPFLERRFGEYSTRRSLVCCTGLALVRDTWMWMQTNRDFARELMQARHGTTQPLRHHHVLTTSTTDSAGSLHTRHICSLFLSAIISRQSPHKHKCITDGCTNP